MSESTRRKFLHDVGVGLGTAAVAGTSPILTHASIAATPEAEIAAAGVDPQSALDGHRLPLLAALLADGLLLPGRSSQEPDWRARRAALRPPGPGRRDRLTFPEVVKFSLEGMEANQVGWQRLEAPGIPIIHTRLDRPEAFLHITTFATRREGEGRVDNVILEVEPRTEHQLAAVPLVILRTKREVKLKSTPEGAVLRLDNEKAPPFLLSDKPLMLPWTGGVEVAYPMTAAVISAGQPFRCFLRFPQEGQEAEKLKDGLAHPDPIAGGGARILAELEAL